MQVAAHHDKFRFPYHLLTAESHAPTMPRYDLISCHDCCLLHRRHVELGVVAQRSGLEAFFPNGSYVAIRKLRQKVPLFWKYLYDKADTLDGHTERVGCRIRRAILHGGLKDAIVDACLHPLLRRGFFYDQLLPENAVDGDGQYRGIVIAVIKSNSGLGSLRWLVGGDG